MERLKLISGAYAAGLLVKVNGGPCIIENVLCIIITIVNYNGRPHYFYCYVFQDLFGTPF